MDVVCFIDMIYETRSVSNCIIILDDELKLDKVRRICEAKLYPVNSERFMLFTWNSYVRTDVTIQDFDTVILSKYLPLNMLIPLIRMNSIVFIV